MVCRLMLPAAKARREGGVWVVSVVWNGMDMGWIWAVRVTEAEYLRVHQRHQHQQHQHQHSR